MSALRTRFSDWIVGIPSRVRALVRGWDVGPIRSKDPLPRDPFLNYDANWLIREYYGTERAHADTGYVLLEAYSLDAQERLSPALPELERLSTVFRLEPFKGRLRHTVDEAMAALKSQGRISGFESVMRVSEYRKNPATLVVQEGSYEDQCRSN